MHSTNTAVFSSKLPETSLYFKEEGICERLVIPHQNPGMLRLLSVTVWPEIDSYNIIETEVGRSYEGQNLTGTQLCVDVKLNQKLSYVADNCQQSVHAAYFTTIETVLVVLPGQLDDLSICDLLNSKSLTITAYIEAVDARMLDCDTVQNCMLMLVDVKLHHNKRGGR